MFVAGRESADTSAIHLYEPDHSFLPRLGRLARREYLRRQQSAYPDRPEGVEHFRDDRSIYGSDVLEQIPHADILNLHWIAEFIDYRKFLPVAVNAAPVVWTLHDMNPFTGGCHYDLGCGRYKQSCGSCPQLGSNQENDLSRQIWKRKEETFRQINPDRVRIVAGSQWLANAARSSSLFSRFHITTIHCGLDPDVFCPRESGDLRAALQIPKSAFVVLFAADQIGNQRKGLSLLLQALKGLPKDRQIYLLSAGGGSQIEAPFPHIHLGKFSSDQMLSLFYSVGDCFVIPSIQEVFGLTALEAMACGTPVIGFDTGGIPDMVRPGKTGLLAPTGDVATLTAQIAWMLDHPAERRLMGLQAREMVEKEFTSAIQARRYTSLYEELEKLTPASVRHR